MDGKSNKVQLHKSLSTKYTGQVMVTNSNNYVTVISIYNHISSMESAFNKAFFNKYYHFTMWYKAKNVCAKLHNSDDSMITLFQVYVA